MCKVYLKSSNQDFSTAHTLHNTLISLKTLQVWRSKGLLKCDAVDGLREFNSRLRLPVFWMGVGFFIFFILSVEADALGLKVGSNPTRIFAVKVWGNRCGVIVFPFVTVTRCQSLVTNSPLSVVFCL